MRGFAGGRGREKRTVALLVLGLLHLFLLAGRTDDFLLGRDGRELVAPRHRRAGAVSAATRKRGTHVSRASFRPDMEGGSLRRPPRT